MNEGAAPDGLLALPEAARNGSIKVLKLLMANGEHRVALDKHNRNAIHLAAESRQILAAKSQRTIYLAVDKVDKLCVA